MSQTLAEPTRTVAVQRLYDVLVLLSRSMRARGNDWGNLTGDLTRGDIVTLGVLEARGSIRPGQIAAAMCVGPSVVSRQLTGLERLGLVERGTDPDDGRAELISITDRGHVRLAEARAAMCGALAQRIDEWELQDITRATAMVEDLAQRLNTPVVKKDPHA